MAGTLILMIILFAAVLFLIYFLVALWRDGKPRVKCRVQRVCAGPDTSLRETVVAKRAFTLLQVRREFDSSLTDQKNPGGWHLERWNERYATQGKRKPYKAM